MGEHDATDDVDNGQMRRFMRALLDDVNALERMIDEGMIESDIRRIGAEQEMFLVDRAQRPAPLAPDVLAKLDDPSFTTELARFNLEANAQPHLFGADCLHAVEAELRTLMKRARAVASSCEAEIALIGILPTLRLTDLGLNNMSPNPRYFALNRAMNKLRGGEFRLDIKGLDELHTQHDNVMLESCNTSFQIHFQVGCEEFPRLYNLAQAVTGPVLAAAVNSPTLLGRRLWHETRVALFQQSVDARSTLHTSRGDRPRVHFGDSWVKDSIVEIFKEDIARYRVVLALEESDDPPDEVFARGEVPKLSALRLHNGTIYRWNRPCYGVHEGKPHLRVENRVLPSGPTVVDEVANAAFFFGLMSALAEEYGEIDRHMSFDDAKGNFFAAARHGLQAQFRWIDGKVQPASQLILDHLLPQAREGLRTSGIDEGDIERYLGIIEARVSSGQTGAQWALSSLAQMDEGSTKEARMRALTAATIARQSKGDPVHTWPLASIEEEEDWRHSYQTVGQFMSSEVLTARADDLVDLTASVMEWEQVRHIPVEDDAGRLVGLVTHRDFMRLVGRGLFSKEKAVSVESVMRKDPITCAPTTTTLEAITLMRKHRVSCLPVIEHGQLVGIVTERDFLNVAEQLLVRELAEKADSEDTRITGTFTTMPPSSAEDDALELPTLTRD